MKANGEIKIEKKTQKNRYKKKTDNKICSDKATWKNIKDEHERTVKQSIESGR